MMNTPLYKIAALASLLAAPAAFPAAMAPVVDTGFESGPAVPAGADLNRLSAAADTTRARSGRTSLRVASEPGAAWGYLSFELDGRLDFDAGYEFSVWVYIKDGAKVSVYLSADDGTGGRYTAVNGRGAIEPGKWCRLAGKMFAGDWRRQDRDHRFIVRVNGACWIDDLELRPLAAPSPAQVWPRLEKALHAAADTRASSLKPGDSLVLDTRHAALAPDTARVETVLPAAASIVVPSEGLLAFAIDAGDDLDLTGEIELHHDTLPGAAAPDLRPGLRVTVLADDTVIAAPAVKTAAPWQGVRVPRGSRTIFGLPPGTLGERPAATVPLAPFRLAKGRHYLSIAGPHFRSGGTFARLELRAAPRSAEKPLHAFALLSDTHLGFNRREWRNTLLGSATGGELEAVLRRLKREGAAYAIIAGDLTDDGRRAQFDDIAGIVKRAALPVYGCIGNHDTSRDSRADIAAAIPRLFPAGTGNTEYTLSRPPLRFVILDGSYYKDKRGDIQGYKDKTHDTTTYRDDLPEWLRDTLAADTITPTLVVTHYPVWFARGVSPVSGYDRGKPVLDKKLSAVLDAAPNVVAVLSGHTHHNETAARAGITFIQNPAFAEWPDAYRVFRVYKDRLEWEVRQIPNRGLLREGVIPETALLWQLSTDPGDLAGAIPFSKNRNQ